MFALDGVLDCCSRARAVARQALRAHDWGVAFLTTRDESRVSETLAFVASNVRGSYHKPAPTYWCRDQGGKQRKLKDLLLQHSPVHRVVCFERDRSVLDNFAGIIKVIQSIRSYELYTVINGEAVLTHGNVVLASRPKG